jgi:hypothetical protein
MPRAPVAALAACLLGCSAPTPARPPAPPAAPIAPPAAPGSLDDAGFRALMRTIATGWNDGDSRKSADCFTEDAAYLEPPDAQSYRGREALYEFFGGARQPPSPGRMTWHHLAFDPAAQVGFGEYTYRGQNLYHGIVVVKLRAGRVSRWREYQYRSTLPWADFVGPSKF